MHGVSKRSGFLTITRLIACCSSFASLRPVCRFNLPLASRYYCKSGGTCMSLTRNAWDSVRLQTRCTSEHVRQRAIHKIIADGIEKDSLKQCVRRIRSAPKTRSLSMLSDQEPSKLRWFCLKVVKVECPYYCRSSCDGPTYIKALVCRDDGGLHL